MEEDRDSFNYWPAFADLMMILIISITLILLFVPILNYLRGKDYPTKIKEEDSEAIINETDNNGEDISLKNIEGDILTLEMIKSKQLSTINLIANKYCDYLKEENIIKDHNNYEKLEILNPIVYIASSGTINIEKPEKYDFKFIYDLTEQKITFSEQILFNSGESSLRERGEKVLDIVGIRILEQIKNIREIQIIGHADINVPSSEDRDNPDYRKFNLELAADRAISVFTFFRDEVGIKPYNNSESGESLGTLMSATSFGEYVPVARSENLYEEDGSYWSWEKINQENVGEKKDLNRRVEIIIKYKYSEEEIINVR
jgi:flagellar motor protein MotB